MARNALLRVRSGAWRAAVTAAALGAGILLFAASGHAQERVLSSEIEISREAAVLRVELEAERRTAFALRNGRVVVDNRDIGAAPRGGELDRAWRALLNDALDTPSAELGSLLAGWTAPDTETGRLLQSELRGALAAAVGVDTADTVDAAPADDALVDSVARMRERIQQLERSLADVERSARRATARPAQRGPDIFAPLRHVGRGLAGIFALIVTYAVLFGIAVIAIFFGGRRYIEGVGDTVRHATMRSLLVGIAGTFLVIPVFVLGIIALAISIVGIPALLVWAPLYPVAVVAAALLGYLGVAHAAGESFAERRFSGETWYELGNSYYFLLTGLGLLIAFFLAAHVVQMAGPWLGFIRGLLTFIGVVVTWAALTIGFGAVLISRGGTRPVRSVSAPDFEPDLFTEDARV